MENTETPQTPQCCSKTCGNMEESHSAVPIIKSIQQKDPKTELAKKNVFGIFDELMFYY